MSRATPQDIRSNLAEVRERIETAARRAGRDPDRVRLVAVTKTIPADLVGAALEDRVTDVGENRVQEAMPKRDELRSAYPGVRWHLIGHLQKNKAGKAVSTFDLIHSVDSLRLAEALSRAAQREAETSGASREPVAILLQVSVSGEETKSGVSPDEAAGLVRAVSLLPHLTVAGLMTIAPLSADPEDSRPIFRRLAALSRELDALRLPGVSMDLLSMGMSQDYEVAVAEGANLVRVGTAIFGPRGG